MLLIRFRKIHFASGALESRGQVLGRSGAPAGGPGKKYFADLREVSHRLGLDLDGLQSGLIDRRSAYAIP